MYNMFIDYSNSKIYIETARNARAVFCFSLLILI